jgi:glycine/D-amino acid oxidase-like deaminating enzyme
VSTDCDILVTGGGFYGCMIAAHLRRRFPAVRLLERGPELLGRASYSNQARVHQGYHYPRSLVTGVRSRANYTRFTTEFPESVRATFHKVYAIGKEFSKVSAAQFDLFCRRIGAPIEPAPAPVRRMFDPTTVEDVFTVEEIAFDAVALRQRMIGELETAGVEVSLETEVTRIRPDARGRLRVTARGADGESEITAGQVFNCTYARLNQIAAASGLPITPLKHELAEMALVRTPPELTGLGVTVMCGPFFSCMPFPSAGLHTLSHVRYTPHASYSEPSQRPGTVDDAFAGVPRRTAFDKMRRDAARFLPAVAKVEYVRSLWEVKTVLPVNETDDGRPILFRPDAGVPNYHLVLGAKIDNVFDVLDRIDGLLGREPLPKVA